MLCLVCIYTLQISQRGNCGIFSVAPKKVSLGSCIESKSVKDKCSRLHPISGLVGLFNSSITLMTGGVMAQWWCLYSQASIHLGAISNEVPLKNFDEVTLISYSKAKRVKPSLHLWSIHVQQYISPLNSENPYWVCTVCIIVLRVGCMPSREFFDFLRWLIWAAVRFHPKYTVRGALQSFGEQFNFPCGKFEGC